jgi:hypothetical protein
VRWHAQNLTDGERDPMWRYGRAWINFWRGDGDTGVGYREVLEINPEWHVQPRATAGIGIELGGGDGDTDIQFNLDVGLARFYLTFDSRSFRPLLERILPGRWYVAPDGRRYRITQEQEITIRWHNGGLWWSLWHPTMEWSSETPKWRHGHFDPTDWLLGRHVYSSSDISTEPVEVPMPEKTYAGTVRMFESTWKRPRWPFVRRMVRADIEVKGGIPHPGKGENSWDCDDDATYSLTCQATTPEAAVAKMVESVLRDRRRYGGRNWRPQERAAS